MTLTGKKHGREGHLVGHVWKCCRSGQRQRARRGRCGCQGVLGENARSLSDVTARLHAPGHGHVMTREDKSDLQLMRIRARDVIRNRIIRNFWMRNILAKEAIPAGH